MHCTNCGTQITEGSKFCTTCGTPASTDEGTFAPPTPPISTPGHPPDRAPIGEPPPGPQPVWTNPATSAPESGYIPPPPMPQPGTAKAPLPPVDGGGFMTQGMPQENAFTAFFRGLFDFSFEKHATPHIVKMLFILAIVGAGLWALLTFVSLASVGGGAAVLGLVIAPFFFLIFVAYTRILLELVLSVTRVEQHTRVLADEVRREGTVSDGR